MKSKFLILSVLAIVLATAVYAQPGIVKDAQDAYGSYSTLRGQKDGPLAVKATASLNDAKTAIDKAGSNAKAMALPVTYAVKAEIYASLALRGKDDAATSTPFFATAEEAVKKAKELDTKGENKKAIDEAEDYLGQYKYYDGIKQYQASKYDAAYNAFDYFRTTRPDDTTAIYLTGLAAAAGNKYDVAIKYYNQLITTTKYSKNPDIYSDLSLIYLQKKDTVGAIKIVTEGSVKYPSNSKLAKRAIELNLQTGQVEKVKAQIEKAIAAEPGNKTLYYYGGLTYSQAKDMDKAETMYRKALEIDPNYFEASLNLGFILLNPGINLYNAAQKLDVKKQKEYDDDMAKVAKIFDKAKPVLLHTVEIDPKSIDALVNLKNYYLGTRNTTEASATQKKIDALRQEGGH